MRTRLQIPSNWQDFEALCHQLWKLIWSDPNAQLHGRAGQPQSGVDIFGKPIYTNFYAGVQCKDKNSNLGSKLSKAELIKECGNAKRFNPSLDMFTMATTAPRDAKLQMIARELNHNNTYTFQVHIWSWDDIEAEISSRPTLLETFYPKVPIQTFPNVVQIGMTAPNDQFWAFFSRPSIVQSLGPILRDWLIKVAYEFCDNALLHGKATQVRLEYVGGKFSIIDDGISFNPISGLDASRASLNSHLGSFVFQSFKATYGEKISVKYERVVKDDGQGCNITIFDLAEDIRSEQVADVVDMAVDISSIFSRTAAERLAQSLVIPKGIKELVITVDNVHFLSGAASFFMALRERLPKSVVLTVSYPRGHIFERLMGFCVGLGINIRPR